MSAPFTSHYISKDQKYIFISRTHLELVKCNSGFSQVWVSISRAACSDFSGYHWLLFCINDGNNNMLPIKHATKTALLLSACDFCVIMGMSHTQGRAEWPLKCFYSISPGGWLCLHNHNKAVVLYKMQKVSWRLAHAVIPTPICEISSKLEKSGNWDIFNNRVLDSKVQAVNSAQALFWLSF